ncbi:MAG: hypothetical protein FJY76_01320 [Candidatus Aenigmarchaeota archaeon]|nr:hypothetical protein [Candidatus Aenigmarchaeota archaeon]
MPCEARCCKTSKLIGSPILSENEVKAIGKSYSHVFKKVILPSGKSYYVIKHRGGGRCFFLSSKGRCIIQDRKPLDCLCYPLKYVYSGRGMQLVIDEGCPAAAKLDNKFVEDAKTTAMKLIKNFDKSTYIHWLNNYAYWCKKPKRFGAR